MNPTEYNYASIDVYIRNASRLRSKAVGEMLAAAWRGIKRIAFRTVSRPTYPRQARS